MEAIAWVAPIASVVLAGGGLIAFWSNLASRIMQNKMTAESAQTEAIKANNRIDGLLQEIAHQREATAKNIGRLEATNDGLAHAIKEMTISLRNVVERLDRLVERVSTDPPHS